TAAVLALVTSLCLVFLALAAETATLVVLCALTALFAAACRAPQLAAVTAPAALVHATALACATGAAAGWGVQYTALLVLAVPAAAALLAAQPGDPRTTLGIEAAGAAAGLLAIALAAASADLPATALVLALCGVVTAGAAIRPDRRPAAYVSAGLFVTAAWVRLAAWDVGTPEAYTLPVTVPALLVGALRRRGHPGTSSWAAYGPGLAATLVPSLLTAWGDPDWTRPLLLGLAALAVTLVGARRHLQAPLLLGGTVLGLVAVHELAPYIVQVTDALPRWAPPALAGLLLLALGATYEQRLRDARRVRDFLGTMR
ncbi:integral membrane protein, partial [Streptomyces zinciresistens K42]